MKKLLTICAVVAFVLALSGLAQADTRYVGSGETYTTIQAAIDAALPGDTILVHPGTYYETHEHGPGGGVAVEVPWFPEGAAGLTIESTDGPANTIIDCDMGGTDGWAGSGVKIVSNNITFTGFTVKNAYTVVGQVSAKNHTLSNLIITDFVNVGLELMAVHDCTFSNITIHTNKKDDAENRTVKGIDMQEYGSGGNTNNTFEDITIYDIETTETYGSSMGIYWEGDNAATHPTTNNIFTNVTIYDMVGPWIGIGIYMYGQDDSLPAIVDTTFSGGSIYNCSSTGIYVLGGCKNLSISGLDITNNGKHGIGIRHYYGTACENVDINCNNIVGHTSTDCYGVKNYEGDNDVDATNNWWGDASGPSGVGLGTGDAVSDYVLYDPWTPGYSCSGFEPPMDKGAVKVKKNRVLPLKAELLDVDGNPVTGADIIAPPVIQVMFESGTAPAEDVTDDALSAGQGDDGNQFVFTGSNWQFNLKTKNYSSPGTYTITMVSGDECEYVIESTCEALFVIE